MLKVKDIFTSLPIAIFALSFWVFLCTKIMVLTKIVIHNYQVDTIELSSFLIMIVSLVFSVKNLLKEQSIMNSKNLEKANDLELRLSAINSTNAVIEFKPDGTIISVNQKFKTLFKYCDEIIGQHHSILVLDNVKNSDGYKQFWKDLAVGKHKSGHFHRLNKQGDDVWIIGTYVPIRNRKGDVVKIFKIAQDNTEKTKALEMVNNKNVYLEHAAKILRHDMHSGINTYMPRGLKSLLRRLDEKTIDKLKIDVPIRMISEGLLHTQQVYNGVYEFTNLVKEGSKLEMLEYDITYILKEYLKRTSYSSMVKIDNLEVISVNQSLFCTAIDNLIRNGLKYNDSKTKYVKIYNESIKNGSGSFDKYIVIEDNGRGMTQQDFENYCKPYVRKKGQKESGSGLGLNICSLILKEHGFSINAEKLSNGTKLRIKYD
jgi:PAS domain S-box-containing protein